MNDRETGNPVFDYRAGYRRKADAVQGVLIKGGALLFIAGAIAAFLTEKQNRQIACWSATAGLVAIIAGIVWGFYWRNTLSAEFREKFGGNDK